MDGKLFVSIIIPVYNASQYLDQCLMAILTSSYSSYEIIMVDDGSTDDSAELARKKGAKVLQLTHQSGPAAARNYGAQQARGDVLFFIDSDVLVQRETVARVVSDFQENPDIAAVFGSYDDNPAEKNFISQFKNLFHHFVHQQASSDAMTFWAGCGAIRREIFEKVGGFNQERYTRPEIEDIELGYRMKGMGYQILLDKHLQVKHLKQWRLASVLRADILCRAVPWSKLILEQGSMIKDLNLQITHRVSAGLVGLSVVVFPLSFFEPRLLFGILFLLGIIFALNHRLYGFFLQRRGLKFAMLAFPMHLFYYFYSSVTFAVCWGMHIFDRRQSSLDRI